MQSLGLKRLAPKIAKHPRRIAFLLLAITVLSTVLLVAKTKFTGDITENLRNNSETYRSFQLLEKQFHPFSQDESLLIRSADLSKPETYQKFQDFLLDLQFASQVQAAFSIFSLPDIPNVAQGEGMVVDKPEPSDPAFFLTTTNQLHRPAKERLTTLRQSIPLADKMLSEDLTATIVMLMLSPAEPDQPIGLTPKNQDEIRSLAAPYSDAFTISFIGIPEIQRTIRTTLNKDQKTLTIASTLLCILIAWSIFRSWRGALICSVPPIIGVIWYLGFLAIFGIPIDFLTSVVPTMVIVIAFADGVHLYMSIQRKRTEDHNTASAISYGIATTGPACFLASLTTALAFVGIGLGGAETMHRLSVTGAVGIMLAFLSVLFVLPTLAHFLLDQDKEAKALAPRILNKPGRPAVWLASRHRGAVLIFSVILSGFLIAIHIALPASFRVTDYLSEDVPIRQNEIFVEQKMGGSGQLYAILADPDGKSGLSQSDREDFTAILTSLNKQLTKPIQAEPIVQMMRYLDGTALPKDNIMLSRFISHNGLSYLIPIPLGTMLAAEQISSYTDGLLAQLEADGLSGKVKLAGLSLLTAKETPKLISDLRTGLISAVLIVILSIMIIMRSVRVGLAFMLPNLIPILTVEAYFWVIDKPLSMTAVIALTIAFGIAVDNSIHLLNQYRLAQSTHQDILPNDAMAHAIWAITPAFLATTLLLVAGLSMTQLSGLPSVVLFGQLVITALFVALLADLYILPSFLLALERKSK